MNFPSGMSIPNVVFEKLAPRPISTSESFNQDHTALGAVLFAAPSDSGWRSSNADFPGIVVITGICIISANSFSSSVAAPYKTPWPAQITGFFAFPRALTASLTSERLGEVTIALGLE